MTKKVRPKKLITEIDALIGIRLDRIGIRLDRIADARHPRSDGD